MSDRVPVEDGIENIAKTGVWMITVLLVLAVLVAIGLWLFFSHHGLTLS